MAFILSQDEWELLRFQQGRNIWIDIPIVKTAINRLPLLPEPTELLEVLLAALNVLCRRNWVSDLVLQNQSVSRNYLGESAERLFITLLGALVSAYEQSQNPPCDYEQLADFVAKGRLLCTALSSLGEIAERLKAVA